MTVIGWREWVRLPQLGLGALRAKIDTATKISTLNALHIETFGPINRPKVRFGVRAVEGNQNLIIYCTAPIKDRRYIKPAASDTISAESEFRTIIETELSLGPKSWPIEISLSSEEGAPYPLLLGRDALDASDIMVEPSEDFLQETLSYDIYKTVKTRSPVARALRIALLTMEPSNYSNKKIIRAAEQQDHVIETIETTSCYMNINSRQGGLHYNGEPLPRFDAVIPRIGPQITSYGTSIMRQFDMAGAFCLNSAEAILHSRDKLLA
ncbi:unnamed protein product, partial [Scytosiphon promiscuus]